MVHRKEPLHMIYPIAVISNNQELRSNILFRLKKRFELASVKAHIIEFNNLDHFDNHEHFEVIFVDCNQNHDYYQLSQTWFKSHHCHIILIRDKISTQIEFNHLIYTLTLLKEDYNSKFENIVDSVLDSLYLNNYVQNFMTRCGQMQRIPLQHILYIKHHQRYTYIHTIYQKVFQIKIPLRQILEAYNTYHLCAINKGVVINWMHIKNLNNKQIYLSNGEALNIAPRRLKEIRHSFLFYCNMPN